jgi:hypothetical protein
VAIAALFQAIVAKLYKLIEKNWVSGSTGAC